MWVTVTELTVTKNRIFEIWRMYLRFAQKESKLIVEEFRWRRLLRQVRRSSWRGDRGPMLRIAEYLAHCRGEVGGGGPWHLIFKTKIRKTDFCVMNFDTYLHSAKLQYSEIWKQVRPQSGRRLLWLFDKPQMEQGRRGTLVFCEKKLSWIFNFD